MEFSEILKLLVIGVGSLISILFQRAMIELKSLRESVEKLNTSVAIVITRLEMHDKRIENLEKKKYDNKKRSASNRSNKIRISKA